MNYVVELIENKNLTTGKLNQIVSLKMQHWHYSREEHIRWIHNNISENDYHLLLCDNLNNLLGYLNLVDVTVNYISDSQKYIGIGNVCVDFNFSSKGYGLLIMNLATFFLKQLAKPGILLCKQELNAFYLKAGWNLYEGKSFIGYRLIPNSVFTTNILSVDEIYISKNF